MSGISILASGWLSNELHVRSQTSCPSLVTHWPSLQLQPSLAGRVKHPFWCSDAVAITVGNRHAFYSFAVAVKASSGTRAGAEDSETKHFTCFEPSK